MPYRGEDLQDALHDLLVADLPAALDAVEVRWAADPITLPDPVTYAKGYRTDILDLPSTSFPIVTIVSPRRDPDGPVRTKMQKVQHQVALQAWTVGETEAEVNKLVHRYTEGIIDVLQDNKVIGGFRQENYEPQVQITVSARHLKDGTSGDYYVEADVDYIRMSEITIVFSRESV